MKRGESNGERLLWRWISNGSSSKRSSSRRSELLMLAASSSLSAANEGALSGDCRLTLRVEAGILDRTPRGGLQNDELVSRYTVQCTTQKQNKTPRVYKARQYTRCTCKMSSATSCSVRVPRGSYVNQERVTEKACLRALCREMMED